MRLLDLFSGAGGAAAGYHAAGFEPTGVDINPQPRYPYRFVQADALAYLAEHGHEYDAIHASPPCQLYSRSRSLSGRDHPDLLPPTRDALVATGVPWVIENVEGAPMVGTLTLCGTEFGLTVRCGDGVRRELRRHRLFESSVWLMGAGGCTHHHPAVSVFGNGGGWRRSLHGTSYQGTTTERRAVMGIDWMRREELSQAIPPTYTRHVGEQLMAHIQTLEENR